MSLSKLCKQITTATEKAIQASIEMYINKKFGNLDKGYYELDSTDLHYIQKSKSKSKIFFDRLFYHFATEKNLIQEARKACGYEIDSLHTDEISKGRVFVVTERGNQSVDVKIKDTVNKSVPADYISYLKVIGLFANFINGSQEIREIWITSYWRTPEEQCNIVYKNVTEYKDETEPYAMYRGITGKTARQMVKEGKSEEEIKAFIMSRIPNNTGFKHVNNSNTLDIGANAALDPDKACFIKSLEHFKSKAVIIENVLFKDGPEGEQDCHHISFKS